MLTIIHATLSVSHFSFTGSDFSFTPTGIHYKHQYNPFFNIVEMRSGVVRKFSF